MDEGKEESVGAVETKKLIFEVYVDNGTYEEGTTLLFGRCLRCNRYTTPGCDHLTDVVFNIHEHLSYRCPDDDHRTAELLRWKKWT